MLLDLKVIAISSALTFALGVASGWSVRDAFADSDALEAAKAVVEAISEGQAKVDTQAAKFETFRQSLEPARTETRNTIREIYRNVPVPADCALRPDALGVLENARQRANAAASGQSVEPVPSGGADPADRP